MAKSRLLTPSVIGSIRWFTNCPNSWREKATQDLTNTLCRIWTTPNALAQRGINMEKKVYEIVKEGKEVECSPEFRILLEECKGAEIQKKGKKFIDWNGSTYCVYGKYDAWFPDMIKDLKSTKSYSQSKYIGSEQHNMYCYIEDIPQFRYVVAEMSDDPENNKIKNVHKIDITVDLKKAEQEVIEYIKYVEKFFEEYPSFKEMYLEKYCLY